MHTLPLPGDLVWIRQKRWRVERVRRDRHVVRLDVANRDARLTFLSPFDRPGTINRSDRLKRVRPQQAIARLAASVGRAFGVRTLASVVDANIAILPHQLEPALAFLHGARRVLVADDVGLGKTIQAGLVIAEVLRRGPSARVLVIVPGALTDQWTEELGARFRVVASRADSRALQESSRSRSRGGSPWDRPGVFVASLDYLKQPHVMDSLPLRPWDLVVVDEAHGVCGDSLRHDSCHEMLCRSRRCLLLTATPHSGDEERFARLIELGKLEGDTLTIFRRTRQDVRLPVRRVVRWQGVTLSPVEQRVLATLRAFEAAVLRSAGATGRAAALLLLSVLRKRALSTMAALGRSLDRRLAWLGEMDREDLEWLQPALVFGDDQDDSGDDERTGLTAASGLSAAHERSWLRRIRGLVDAALAVESKAAHLEAVLRRTCEPVVVFTEFRHSLELLQRRLARVRPLAVLHGGQTDVERRQQLGRFTSGPASLLLATDVAGQGLNLQARARWVVSLELPWNPARIEQRLGRVDRIGQTRGVHGTLLVARDGAESGLLANLARRTLTARQTFAGAFSDTGVPDEIAIAAALIDQAPVPAAPARPPLVSVCRSWSRHARVAAGRLQSSRSLASRWRRACEAGSALWSYFGPWSSLGLPADTGAVLAFTVPVLDLAGTVVERHVVTLSLRQRIGRGAVGEVVTHGRRVAALVRFGRANRAARFVRRLAACETAADRMLFARMEHAWIPAEAQPGLFDRREQDAFEAATLAGLRLEDDATEASATRDRTTKLSIGRPVLELVLLARP